MNTTPWLVIGHPLPLEGERRWATQCVPNQLSLAADQAEQPAGKRWSLNFNARGRSPIVYHFHEFSSRAEREINTCGTSSQKAKERAFSGPKCAWRRPKRRSWSRLSKHFTMSALTSFPHFPIWVKNVMGPRPRINPWDCGRKIFSNTTYV